MKNDMRPLRILLVAASLALVVVACDSTPITPDTDSGSIDSGSIDSGSIDSGSIDSGPVPLDANLPPGARGAASPPTVGVQIDRMGRPAISTATVGTFMADDAARNALKDGYAANSDPATWMAMYSAPIAQSLAILDGLDTVCGNQLLAAPTPSAGRYATLASVFADDRLWLDVSAADSTVYLAVEADATGIFPNADGGGRRLSFDVIDTSYSALAVGALTGLDDGVAPDADTMGTTFPYLAAPH